MRDRYFALYQQCRLNLPDDQAEHLSLDYVVNLLIDDKLSHRRRARRQRAKRKKIVCQERAAYTETA